MISVHSQSSLLSDEEYYQWEQQKWQEKAKCLTHTVFSAGSSALFGVYCSGSTHLEAFYWRPPRDSQFNTYVCIWPLHLRRQCNRGTTTCSKPHQTPTPFWWQTSRQAEVSNKAELTSEPASFITPQVEQALSAASLLSGLDFNLPFNLQLHVFLSLQSGRAEMEIARSLWLLKGVCRETLGCSISDMPPERQVLGMLQLAFQNNMQYHLCFDLFNLFFHDIILWFSDSLALV